MREREASGVTITPVCVHKYTIIRTNDLRKENLPNKKSFFLYTQEAYFWENEKGNVQKAVLYGFFPSYSLSRLSIFLLTLSHSLY